MHYRRFGKLDWQGSALGFGCMRLPVIDRDQSKINEPLATEMLRTAIDQGVNYVDTAYPYHAGNSERFLGRALKDGYREKVRLATKLPARMVRTRDDFDRFLHEQLEKLQTDHIDFYLLHGLRAKTWQVVRDLGVLSWAEKAMADGYFRHLGFSFHDSLPVFKGIIDSYDGWTFCQIQYNYMDIEEQAGTQGLKYAASKGLAVVIMEPLMGGRIVTAPEPVQKVWDTAPQKRTPAEWAFRWLWNQPEVSVVLSGMSAMQHVVENLASASAPDYDQMSPEELALVDQVREKYRGLSPIPCTKCEYCMPCPNGLNIPYLLDLFNAGKMFNRLELPRMRYSQVPEGARAGNCQACRECEEKCPQEIEISEWMTRVHAVLGEGKTIEEVLEGAGAAGLVRGLP